LLLNPIKGVQYISFGVAAKVIFVLGYGPLWLAHHPPKKNTSYEPSLNINIWNHIQAWIMQYMEISRSQFSVLGLSSSCASWSNSCFEVWPNFIFIYLFYLFLFFLVFSSCFLLLFPCRVFFLSLFIYSCIKLQEDTHNFLSITLGLTTEELTQLTFISANVWKNQINVKSHLINFQHFWFFKDFFPWHQTTMLRQNLDRLLSWDTQKKYYFLFSLCEVFLFKVPTLGLSTKLTNHWHVDLGEVVISKFLDQLVTILVHPCAHIKDLLLILKVLNQGQVLNVGN
jgi:hypothetical protein